MKNKIQEVENEDFMLKFIKDPINKGIGSFAICKFKTSKKISFKFDFEYLLTQFQNCEMTFDLNKKTITAYSPNPNESFSVFVEEKIQNDINKFDYSKSFDLLSNDSFDLMKYNIVTQLKFAIDERITKIEKNFEYFNNLIKLITDTSLFISNNKNIVLLDEKKNFKTLKEFKDYQNNIENFFDKTKINIKKIKNIIIYNLSKYTFELKGKNFIFISKNNEYIFYLYKLQKLEINYTNNNLDINYTTSEFDIHFTINSKDEINLQHIGKLIIYLNDDISFIGNICTNNNEFFGIEKGKKYLYIGNFIKDNFCGLGILITPLFCYKGKFSNSCKNDKNGYIIFDENNFYEGGILGDELSGMGKYQNKKGLIIEGNFEKDEIKGLCKFTFNNGDEYKGEMIGNVKKGEWSYVNKKTGRKLKAVFNDSNNEIKYDY